MSDHASSSAQASMKNNMEDWVREEFEETKREIFEIIENKKRNDAGYGRYENDDEIMANKEQHCEGSRIREKLWRFPFT